MKKCAFIFFIAFALCATGEVFEPVEPSDRQHRLSVPSNPRPVVRGVEEVVEKLPQINSVLPQTLDGFALPPQPKGAGEREPARPSSFRSLFNN